MRSVKKKINIKSKKKYGGSSKRKIDKDYLSKNSKVFYYNPNRSNEILPCTIIKVNSHKSIDDLDAEDTYTIKMDLDGSEKDTVEKNLFKELKDAENPRELYKATKNSKLKTQKKW